jgi:hypothetical protein
MKPIVLALLFTLTLAGGPAMAVEEPTYTTLLHENDFELRNYPALVVAEVTVTGDRNAAANKGFRLLAGYIFGGNTSRQSIAMTAPVVETRSQTIPMTAPVLQTAVDGAWTIRFTMPAGSTLDSLPIPNNPAVHLHTAPATRFAVVRFSGLIGAGVVERKVADLDGFIGTHKLRALGPPSLAQYDPPWTLWFLRRNEIMIPVEAVP